MSWTKKVGGNNNDIERFKFDFDKPTKLRLVGTVLCRYVYWVPTNNGKKVPVECLRFDRQKEEFTDAADPIKDKVDSSVFGDKPSFAYVAQAIDRADGKIKLLDLKTTIYNAIVDYAVNPEYGNPADSDKGYDLVITKTKTGPATVNVQYGVTPSRASTPLTEEEKKLERFDLETIMKRPTYDQQYEWLVKNTALIVADYPEEFGMDGKESEADLS